MRGQVERANLRAYSKADVVTAAESVRTCQTEAFFGREYVKTVERICEKNDGRCGETGSIADKESFAWKCRAAWACAASCAKSYDKCPEVLTAFLSAADFCMRAFIYHHINPGMGKYGEAVHCTGHI